MYSLASSPRVLFLPCTILVASSFVIEMLSSEGREMVDVGVDCSFVVMATVSVLLEVSWDFSLGVRSFGGGRRTMMGVTGDDVTVGFLVHGSMGEDRVFWRVEAIEDDVYGNVGKALTLTEEPITCFDALVSVKAADGKDSKGETWWPSTFSLLVSAQF